MTPIEQKGNQKTNALIGAVLDLMRQSSVREHREFLEKQFMRFVTERDTRASAIQSPEIQKAREIARSLFPVQPTGILCFDGRHGPAVKWGIPGRAGKFLRLPGGNPLAFVQSKDGHGLRLLEKSEFGRVFSKLLSGADIKTEILDSHLHCAAREREEVSKGEKPSDHGLWADVVRKRDIGKAMTNFAKKHFPNRRFFPIQVSYDPHSGYGYMGLETTLEETSKTGFTEEVLEKLSQKGEIISTKLLGERPDFAETLKRESPQSFDLVANYPNSMMAFWETMDRIKILLPSIRKALLGIYPNMKEGDPECEERAILLLANLLSSHLNNRQQFPFKDHQEEIIVVTEREHGPFGMMSFPVFGNDLVALAHDVIFASSIVRGTREKGIIEGLPKDPVPVVIQEIVRVEYEDSVWNTIRDWDFTSLSKLDYDATTEDVLKMLDPRIPHGISMGIGKLWEKMRILFNPKREAASHITGGNIVVIATVCDGYRRTRLVLPFVLNGY